MLMLNPQLHIISVGGEAETGSIINMFNVSFCFIYLFSFFLKIILKQPVFSPAYTHARYQAMNTLSSGCHGDGSHIPRMGSKVMQWAGCWDGVLRPFAHTVFWNIYLFIFFHLILPSCKNKDFRKNHSMIRHMAAFSKSQCLHAEGNKTWFVLFLRLIFTAYIFICLILTLISVTTETKPCVCLWLVWSKLCRKQVRHHDREYKLAVWSNLLH